MDEHFLTWVRLFGPARKKVMITLWLIFLFQNAQKANWKVSKMETGSLVLQNLQL